MRLPALLHLAPLASARPANHAHQIPIVPQPADDIPAPATTTDTLAAPSIGLHFTTSYAAAAAHYANGTTRDLLTMDGDDDYKELILRWTASHSKNAGPFESSDDVVLSGFMVRLQKAIVAELDSPLGQAALALSPQAPALQQKFQKAMFKAGLASSKDSAIVYEEAMATHAALKPAAACTTQSKPGQLQHVLFLAFDDGAFSASMHEYACGNYSPQAHMISRLTRAELGWWHLPMYDMPRAKFWAQVQESIAHVLRLQEKPPGRIVLLGSHGGDAEFKQIVEEALWRELEVDVSNMLGVNELGDSQWLAARGAAELAWRHS
ncbi:hypothetical protein ACJBU6_05856 [Exserohilum turcicum]